MAYDLLLEPLLSWRDGRRTRRMATLPGVLAKLAAGELADFPRVRAHQFHPWSMFLVQLAAIALHGAGRTDPSVSEDEWCAMLLALTGQAREPWCLVVEDLSKSAFFQPAIPEASTSWVLAKEWQVRDRPDDLDMLITAKAHDVKSGLLDATVPEFWVYAIVTLQTMQGYAGGSGGYNKVSRMKSGLGNRPRVGLAPDVTPAAHFRRDVTVLLDGWSKLVGRGFNDRGGALVWTEPWDGVASLDFKDLSPHFIEICQRIRCLLDDNGLRCAKTTSRKRRCLPSIDNGDVGDPWIPVQRDGGALTVGSRGFGCELLTRLLLGDEYEMAAAQMFRTDDRDLMLFVGAALARGNGKTEGLHERLLVLEKAVTWRLRQPEQRTALGRRARTHLERAKTMGRKVLFPARKALALGGEPLMDSFDARADEVFFPQLFASLDLDDHAAQLAWEKRLIDMARKELDLAINRSTLSTARRYRAIAHAQLVFNGALRRLFPDAIAQPVVDGREAPRGVTS